MPKKINNGKLKLLDQASQDQEKLVDHLYENTYKALSYLSLCTQACTCDSSETSLADMHVVLTDTKAFLHNLLNLFEQLED